MILQLLFAILNFIMSTWGVMCLLIGAVLFIMIPMVSTVSRIKGPANFFLRLATFPLKRAAVVISEHNDALFKTMRFDGLGVEMITIDGEPKAFEDPDNALHHFLGIPFALADEEHGVLFDTRHAAAGMRKRALNQKNESMFLATEDEWERFDVSKWIPGVFQFPRKHELVDLSAVQELVDGGERSEYAKRVEEMYQHSQDPFGSGTPAMKYLYPIIAIAITFGGTWFMASQIGLPNTGASSSVSFDMLTLLVSAGGIPTAKLREDGPFYIGLFLLVATPLATVGALYYFFGPILTLAAVVTTVLGFLILPALTFMSQPSQALAGVFSKLYFKLGFFGFRKPVVDWTPTKYVVREYDQLDTTKNVEWYDLWGHTVGFTFEPEEDSWGAEVMKHGEIENSQPAADGGEISDTHLPNKYVRSDMKRDTYGGFLPKRVRDDHYYLHSGIVLERFNNSADGEKALKKLLEAKEIHGGGNDGIDDSVVFKTSVVTGLIGLVAGIGIFILPAFL